MCLEDDPVFRCGLWLALEYGWPCGMRRHRHDGATLRSGAAARCSASKIPFSSRVNSPRVVRNMMLVAEGAERFAKEQGIILCKPGNGQRSRARAWMKSRATNTPPSIIAATSRNRRRRRHRSRRQVFRLPLPPADCCKLPGRVGDSRSSAAGATPTPKPAAFSCTGYGEAT